MSTPKFIVSHEDQQLGPFTEVELRQKWTSGAILGVDYVYDEAKADWIMIAERFRWAADGALTDTIRVSVMPAAMTEEITVELSVPPPVPVKATPPAPPVAPVVVEDELDLNFSFGEKTAAVPAAQAIQMTDGYGEISLDAMDAGSIELKLRNSDMPTARIRLDLLPSDPTTVRWTLPTVAEVGRQITLSLEVTDDRGLVCRTFQGEFTVVTAGKRHLVKTIDGAGRLEFTQEKAEVVSVHLESDPSLTLTLPAMQKLEWTPGPAVKLVVDGPTEHQSGIPLKVRVKALDQYGNVARSYQGMVSLDVKAG